MIGLSHPCRSTCSGWDDGFKKGQDAYLAKCKEVEDLREITKAHIEMIRERNEERDALQSKVTDLEAKVKGMSEAIRILRYNADESCCCDSNPLDGTAYKCGHCDAIDDANEALKEQAAEKTEGNN